MGPTQIGGLPAHVLLVHFVVVGVPLSALLLVTAALWPAARRRLGLVTPVVALVTLASVPVATHTGEWLQRRVTPDPLVRAHTQLGDTLLPWVTGLFLAAAAIWALEFLATRTSTDRAAVLVGAAGSPTPGQSAPRRPAAGPVWAGTPARTVLAVLALVVAVGSTVQVYRIGESGSRAAWHRAYQQTPTGD